MDKKALLFIDEGVAKVVYGSSLKCVKLSEAALPYNAQFFQRLFQSCQVLVVQSVDILTPEKFQQTVSEVAPVQAPAPPPAPVPVPQQTVSIFAPPPPMPQVQTQPAQTVQTAVLTPQVQAQRQQLAQTRPPESRPGKTSWVKSNARTTIIIDDIFTNQEIMPGVRKALSVPSGRAVNLAGLDPTAIRGSMILRKLLQNGTLSPCSAEEAAQLENDHWRAQQADNDARLQAASPIVDLGRGTAADYAESISIGGGGRQIIAPTVDITGDVNAGGGWRGGGSRMSNETHASMEDLMATLNAAPPPNIPSAPSHALAARPKAEVNPAMKAAPVVSRHEY